MKFTSTFFFILVQAAIPLAMAATAAPADANACRPFCCDAVVPGIRPTGNVGINCTPGGIDCGFSGQTTACCARLGSLGAQTGTAIGCI